MDNRLAVDSLSMHLGKGEAEAIILAKEKNTLLIIDDKDGKIDLRKSLDELIASGFRLSKSEYKKIIGEI